MARHGSLESLERPHADPIAIIPSKPRKKEIELSDHIEFLITEKSMPKTSSSSDTARELTADDDIISDGKYLLVEFKLPLSKRNIFHFFFQENKIRNK